MKWTLLFAAVLSCGLGWASGGGGNVGKSAGAQGSLGVSGYLPEYRMAAEGGYDFARAEGLREVLFFSVEPDAVGTVPIKPEVGAMLKKAREQTKARGIRLTLCVGGWGRSKGFAAMSANPESRKVFVSEMVRLAGEYGLDGIDLDWEHPTGEVENANAGLLAGELGTALDAIDVELSSAVAEWQALPKAYFEALDQVNLMAYDADGKHSTMEYAKAAVDTVVKRGAAPGKIVLGLPLYGRKIADAREAMSVGEILTKFAPGEGVDEVGGYYFNSGKTLEEKVRFARERGLAGVMVWELGQDAVGPGALLPRVVSAAK